MTHAGMYHKFPIHAGKLYICHMKFVKENLPLQGLKDLKALFNNGDYPIIQQIIRKNYENVDRCI